MANITVTELNSAQSQALSNSENYLKDLTEREQNIQGGIYNVIIISETDDGGGYAGGYDFDRGVCESIDSSGEYIQ